MKNMYFRKEYNNMTDRELVELAIKPEEGKRPDSEGIVYLIYDRYDPLLHSLYIKVFNNTLDLYHDCLADLYTYLNSGNPEWRKLVKFEWRSSFGTWLKPTAYNRFLEIKPYLIGKSQNVISVDDDSDGKPRVQLPDGGDEEYYLREQRILIMESVSMLKDEDEKFVIIKRLEGYNSKEIACMMNNVWEMRGIVKYNYKNKVKTIVVPDSRYVDLKTQRAKDSLKRILNRIR